MTIDMDWSPDFCLACDRQTPGGAYCSQACRLTDIGKASSHGSEPNSPVTPSWSMGPKGFYLPPAIDFSVYQSHNRPAGSRSSSYSQQGSSLMYPVPKDLVPSIRSYNTAPSSRSTLSPSSSRSSLSSIRSAHEQNPQMSSQTRSELRGYASSFDKTRDVKRRFTVQ